MMITKSVVFIAYKITHHDQKFLGKKSSHLHNHEINFWEKLSPDLKIITNMSYNTSINIMTNNIDSSIENLSFSRRPTHVSLARDNFSILQNEKWGCTERTSLVIIQNHYDWIGCSIHVLSRLVIWGIEVWNHDLLLTSGTVIYHDIKLEDRHVTHELQEVLTGRYWDK